MLILPSPLVRVAVMQPHSASRTVEAPAPTKLMVQLAMEHSANLLAQRGHWEALVVVSWLRGQAV